MEIEIKGTAKEIADLVLELQSQRYPDNLELSIDGQAVAKAIHGRLEERED